MKAYGSKRTYSEWKFTKCKKKKVSVSRPLNVKNNKRIRQIPVDLE